MHKYRICSSNIIYLYESAEFFLIENIYIYTYISVIFILYGKHVGVRKGREGQLSMMNKLILSRMLGIGQLLKSFYFLSPNLEPPTHLLLSFAFCNCIAGSLHFIIVLQILLFINIEMQVL